MVYIVILNLRGCDSALYNLTKTVTCANEKLSHAATSLILIVNVMNVDPCTCISLTGGEVHYLRNKRLILLD